MSTRLSFGVRLHFSPDARIASFAFPTLPDSRPRMVFVWSDGPERGPCLVGTTGWRAIGVAPVMPPQPVLMSGPLDQLNTPTRTNRPPLHSNTGPPESPWQEPRPATAPRRLAGAASRSCNDDGSPMAVSVAICSAPAEDPVAACPNPATRNRSPGERQTVAQHDRLWIGQRQRKLQQRKIDCSLRLGVAPGVVLRGGLPKR
jgi:hypothetical protein